MIILFCLFFFSESIQNTQTRIKELYTRLKDLADERQSKLDENLKLFQFNREIQDLESWIADREFVAGSQDIGQDFDQIQMLEERFDVFAEETRNVGTERVETVNAVADQLIGTGHSDATVIAEWKKGLNEAWENLLEMLNTRKEVCNVLLLLFYLKNNETKNSPLSFNFPDEV